MRKSLIFFLTGLLLVGCSKTIQISQEDALEVAMDIAGVNPEEVSEVSTNESVNFEVSFQTENGKYDYVVDKAGNVLSRTFIENENKPSEKVQEAEDEEEFNIEKITPEEKNALDVALGNLKMTVDMVTDISVETDESGFVNVEFTLQNGTKYLSVINNHGTLVSYYTK